jgi:hypothetical protein
LAPEGRGELRVARVKVSDALSIVAILASELHRADFVKRAHSNADALPFSQDNEAAGPHGFTELEARGNGNVGDRIAIHEAEVISCRDHGGIFK